MTDDIDDYQANAADQEKEAIEKIDDELAAADDGDDGQAQAPLGGALSGGDGAQAGGMGVPGPKALMSMLQSDDGIEQMMQEPVFPTEDGGQVSQAQVLADVINIYKIDAKLDASLHGVDLSIQRVTDRKVAWMLAQLVEGNPGPLIEVFNQIEDMHHEVFEAEMDDAEFEGFVEQKQACLYSQGNEVPDDE